MASTTLARPNHYQTLGLAPGASRDEIARAYSRRLGTFGSRPVADVAQASIAFETLRDPQKRRAYDESIGLGEKPRPRIMATGGHARFVGVAPASGSARPLFATIPTAVPPRSEPLHRGPPSESRTASFIAASLRSREVLATNPAAPPAPEPARSPERIDQFPWPAPERAALRLEDADDSPVRLTRTVAIAGGLIGCVVVLGAFLGLEAGNGEQSQGEPAVTSALPTPRAVAPVAVEASDQPRRAVIEPPQQPARIATARTTSRAVPPRPAPAAPVVSEAVPSVPIEAVDAAVDELAPAPAAAETAAALPLSNATIARTIDRIGYACGRVASTSPDSSGAAGVFKVTCTSGQSYRAAPVNGRYRFRRLGGS